MNTTIAIALLLLGGLAVWHFVYESILLPTILLNIQFKLFKLRDELREIKIEQGPCFSDDVFSLLDSSINKVIHIVPALTVATIAQANIALSQNPELRQRIAERRAKIESCSIERVRALDTEVSSLFVSVYVANSGAWIIYCIPVLVFKLCYRRIVAGIQSLAYSSNNQIAQPFLQPLHTLHT